MMNPQRSASSSTSRLSGAGRISIRVGKEVGNMFRQVGNSDTYMVPPGEVFEIEREEGLRLVARFGGEVIERSGP